MGVVVGRGPRVGFRTVVPKGLMVLSREVSTCVKVEVVKGSLLFQRYGDLFPTRLVVPFHLVVPFAEDHTRDEGIDVLTGTRVIIYLRTVSTQKVPNDLRTCVYRVNTKQSCSRRDAESWRRGPLLMDRARVGEWSTGP